MKTIIFLIIAIIIIEIINNLAESNKSYTKTNNRYSRKKLMTSYEYHFYKTILPLEDELNIKIIPQINLATIVKKENKSRYQTELFRNIDFAIFDYELQKVLLLIEINDSTHNKNSRKKRDKSVKEICKKADIKLITFYTKYSNTKEYVKNRIKRELQQEQNDN